MAISPINTHIILGHEEVNRLVRTVTDELGTRGLTTLSSFPALPLISARLVFTAFSWRFFVLVFRFLRRMRNTHDAKTPVLQRPLSLHRCVFFGVLPVFYASLVAMPFTCQEKAFRTLPVSPNPNQLGPKAHPKPDLSVWRVFSTTTFQRHILP
jgi:hypothetical protein